MPRLLNYFEPIYRVLASIDPSLPRALFVGAIFGLVVLWRKRWPNSWRVYSNLIPISEQQTGVFVTAIKKAWQALPSVLMAAVAGALGTGGNVGASVKLALLGLVPPLVHEFSWRYEGRLGDGRPLAPPPAPSQGQRDHIRLTPPDGDPGPDDNAAELTSLQRRRRARHLVLAFVTLLPLGCGPSATTQGAPPCTPEAHARELEAFTARVNIVCAAYDVPEDCPEYPGLQADFDRSIDAGCRQ